MTVLVVIVILVGLTGRAVADDYSVNAVVAAPPLAAPATITSPSDSQTVHSQELTVSGMCPHNSYIKLFNNGLFSGVTMCDANGQYSIVVSLFVGANSLVTHDYSVTNTPGPDQPGITNIIVYYEPLVPVTLSQIQPTSPNADVDTSQSTSVATLPLVLISDFRYQTFLLDEAFSWSMNINGGRPPFNTHISWGDKLSSSMKITDDAKFTITHSYTKAGFFPIIVKSTDANGRKTELQLAALIKSSSGAYAGSGTPTNASTAQQHIMTILSSRPSNWLLVVWPTIGLVGLMIVCFWLGERKEYALLLQKPGKR